MKTPQEQMAIAIITFVLVVMSWVEVSPLLVRRIVVIPSHESSSAVRETGTTGQPELNATESSQQVAAPDYTETSGELASANELQAAHPPRMKMPEHLRQKIESLPAAARAAIELASYLPARPVKH